MTDYELLASAAALLTKMGLEVCVLGDGAVYTERLSGMCQDLVEQIEVRLAAVETAAEKQARAPTCPCSAGALDTGRGGRKVET